MAPRRVPCNCNTSPSWWRFVDGDDETEKHDGNGVWLVLKGTKRLGGWCCCWLFLVVSCWCCCWLFLVLVLVVVVVGGGGDCRRCDLFFVHGRFVCLVLILVDYDWPRRL